MTAGNGWPQCYSYFFSQLTGCINCGPSAWKAKCPAHNDKVQSLSVRVGNRGQLYVRCHAGGICSLEAILRAANAELDDLFPDNRKFNQSNPDSKGKRHMSRVDTVYQYTDEAGTLLFECVRSEPKNFRQRRPNPDFNASVPIDRETNSEYLYNLQGVRRVLYNLPFLISALARTPDKVIFIVEGEKDVETARAHGIVATTSPMGAGKWQPDYAQFLKGAHVVVIPDNDEPGKAHAKTVCASLHGIARTVRYVELPGIGDKEDFTDWWNKIATGNPDNKKQQLKLLVNAAKLWGKTDGVAPTITPGGTAPAPTLEAKQEVTPVPAQDAKGTAAEEFPNSPTIRGGAGLPNPAPGLLPDQVTAVSIEQPPEPTKPKAVIPDDRAVRVANFWRDVKATASALKMAGVKIESPMAFYGHMRTAIAQMDQAFSLYDGSMKMNEEHIGQISLLIGAYLVTAAADFGLGCGILLEKDKAAEPGK